MKMINRYKIQTPYRTSICSRLSYMYIALPGNLNDLVLLLNPRLHRLYNIHSAIQCASLSLLGTVPPTKIAQLTWPQALHYHHRRGGEGEGGYCKLSHASLTQHLSETQFFTRQRGWARGRETSEEQTMVWQLFSCLLSLAIPFARALLWGGLSQVQEVNEGGRAVSG